MPLPSRASQTPAPSRASQTPAPLRASQTPAPDGSSLLRAFRVPSATPAPAPYIKPDPDAAPRTPRASGRSVSMRPSSRAGSTAPRRAATVDIGARPRSSLSRKATPLVLRRSVTPAGRAARQVSRAPSRAPRAPSAIGVTSLLAPARAYSRAPSRANTRAPSVGVASLLAQAQRARAASYVSSSSKRSSPGLQFHVSENMDMPPPRVRAPPSIPVDSDSDSEGEGGVEFVGTSRVPQQQLDVEPERSSNAGAPISVSVIMRSRCGQKINWSRQMLCRADMATTLVDSLDRAWDGVEKRCGADR